MLATVGTDECLSVGWSEEAHLHEVDGCSKLRFSALSGLKKVRVGGQPSAVIDSAVSHQFRGQQFVALVVVALHIDLGGEAVDAEETPHLVGHEADVPVAAWGVEFQTATNVFAVLPHTLDGSECSLHAVGVEVVGVHEP